jgi:hypothetical protein
MTVQGCIDYVSNIGNSSVIGFWGQSSISPAAAKTIFVPIKSVLEGLSAATGKFLSVVQNPVVLQIPDSLCSVLVLMSSSDFCKLC